MFKLAIKYLLGTHIPLGGNSHVVKHVTPLARDNLRRVSWIAGKRLVRRRSYHDEETMDGKLKLIFLFALFVVGFLLIYLLFCCLRLWRQPAFVCHYDNKKTLADNPVSAMHWRPAIPPSQRQSRCQSRKAKTNQQKTNEKQYQRAYTQVTKLQIYHFVVPPPLQQIPKKEHVIFRHIFNHVAFVM